MRILLSLWLGLTAWPSLGWTTELVDNDSVAVVQTDTIQSDTTSLEYYQRVLEQREQEVASALVGIGYAYKNKGRLNSALKYYRQALPILSKEDDYFSIGRIHQAMGEIFEFFGDSSELDEYYPQAVKQYEMSMDAWEKVGSDSLLAEAHGSLAVIQAKQGAYKVAYQHQQKGSELLAALRQNYLIQPQPLVQEDSSNENDQIQPESVDNASWFTRNTWLLLLGLLLIASAVGLMVLASRLRQSRSDQKEWQKLYENSQKQSDELQSMNIALAKTEKEQRKLNLTKDKLFSIISHDLRSPINTITGFLSVLGGKLRSLGDTELKVLAVDMEESTKKLSRFLDNLLKWSMTQMDQIHVNPEPVDIPKVIEENYHLVEEGLKSKNISFEVNTQGSLTAYADGNMISLVIRNVIANAIKFTGNQGRIQVRGVEEEDLIKVSIIDNGIGISKEDQEKLFDIEQQNILTPSYKDKGAGLGLMLCKEFVEMNGGIIDVESQLGIGTTFTIELPKAKILQPLEIR